MTSLGRRSTRRPSSRCRWRPRRCRPGSRSRRVGQGHGPRGRRAVVRLCLGRVHPDAVGEGRPQVAVGVEGQRAHPADAEPVLAGVVTEELALGEPGSRRPPGSTPAPGRPGERSSPPPWSPRSAGPEPGPSGRSSPVELHRPVPDAVDQVPRDGDASVRGHRVGTGVDDLAADDRGCVGHEGGLAPVVGVDVMSTEPTASPGSIPMTIRPCVEGFTVTAAVAGWRVPPTVAVALTTTSPPGVPRPVGVKLTVWPLLAPSVPAFPVNTSQVTFPVRSPFWHGLQEGVRAGLHAHRGRGDGQPRADALDRALVAAGEREGQRGEGHHEQDAHCSLSFGEEQTTSPFGTRVNVWEGVVRPPTRGRDRPRPSVRRDQLCARGLAERGGEKLGRVEETLDGAGQAGGSAGGTSSPVTPSCTSSGMAPTRVATSGRPRARGSAAERQNASSHREDDADVGRGNALRGIRALPGEAHARPRSQRGPLRLQPCAVGSVAEHQDVDVGRKRIRRRDQVGESGLRREPAAAATSRRPGAGRAMRAPRSPGGPRPAPRPDWEPRGCVRRERPAVRCRPATYSLTATTASAVAQGSLVARRLARPRSP